MSFERIREHRREEQTLEQEEQESNNRRSWSPLRDRGNRSTEAPRTLEEAQTRAQALNQRVRDAAAYREWEKIKERFNRIFRPGELTESQHDRAEITGSHEVPQAGSLVGMMENIQQNREGGPAVQSPHIHAEHNFSDAVPSDIEPPPPPYQRD